MERGDLLAARNQLEAVAAAQPANPLVALALAQTYFKLNDKSSSRAAAERAETLGGDQPAVLHGLAVYYAGAEQFSRAGGLESRYAARAPADAKAILRAMNFYLRANDPKAAIGAARAYPDVDTRADLRNLLGKAYALDSQFALAAQELHAAMTLSPYEEAYIFDAANLYLRLEKFDDAVRVLQEGRKNFDRSAQLEIALGVAYYGLRRFPEAIEQFLKTIRLAPDVEQPYIFLGKLLDQAGERLPEIDARFRQYMEAAPTSYLGYLLHAKALRAQGGNAAGIVTALLQSIERDSGQWESHFELGISWETARDFAAAAREMERAIELNPKEPAPHYRLARVYDRLGQKELAAAQRAIHQALTAKSESR